jgi:hypothetical protein
MGPALGFDARKGPIPKPQEAMELIEKRAETFEGLADIIRATPYPTQLKK